jgi:predicted nucleic acid-binding protein
MDHNWLRVVEPQMVPSEWLSLDLGTGELEAMALALENRRHVIVNHLEDVSMWISDEIKERVLILASEERE